MICKFCLMSTKSRKEPWDYLNNVSWDGEPPGSATWRCCKRLERKPAEGGPTSRHKKLCQHFLATLTEVLRDFPQV
jgi:hypothetical protein